MRKNVGTAIAVVLLAACTFDSIEPQRIFQWQGSTPEGEPGWEHLFFEAVFAWGEDQQLLEAVARVTGDEPGAIRPWFLQRNTCEMSGAIIGADASYPRLNIEANGIALASTLISVDIDPEGTYHVSLRESDDQLENVIACADLALVPDE
jgi:hypothetical protein